MTNFKGIRDYVSKCHDDAGCEYDGQPYIVHVDLVVSMVNVYKTVFLNPIDIDIAIKAALCHDLIEDTQESFNDVSEVIGRDAANVVLCVTDVSAENRLMKHLLTMGKTVMDYRAIILKMCDICANARHSKTHGSSMYKKYVEEYAYRKPNQEVLEMFWNELDEVHDYKKQV